MQKTESKELLDRIASALKYLRANPQLLTNSDIMKSMEKISAQMTDIVSHSKKQRKEVQQQKRIARRAAQKEMPSSRKQRKVDYNKSSDASLRMSYYYYRSRGREIPLQLREAMSKRFHGFNAESGTFTGRRKKSGKPSQRTPVETNRVAASIQEILGEIPLTTRKSQVGKYALIYDNDKKLLQGASEPFELVLFDKKTKVAVVRKKLENTRHKLYLIKCKKGVVLPELVAGAREVRYVPDQHQLFARETNESIQRYWVIAPGTSVQMASVAPTYTPSIRARQLSLQTIIIDENGNVESFPLVSLLPTKSDTKKQRIVKTRAASAESNIPANIPAKTLSAAPVPQPAPAPMPKRPVIPPLKPVPNTPRRPVIHADTQTVEKNIIPATAPNLASASPVTVPKKTLTAQLKPVKRTLDGIYYDVYVNGKRVLKNHFDTRLQTFLAGTLLGVYGIDTESKELPRRPLWQVFNTDLVPRTFSQMNSFSNTHVYIKEIIDTEKQVNLQLSNKAIILLELEKSLRHAKNAQFEIIKGTTQQQK